MSVSAIAKRRHTAGCAHAAGRRTRNAMLKLNLLKAAAAVLDRYQPMCVLPLGNVLKTLG